MALLIEVERNSKKSSASPSRIAVDSQSVKSVAFVSRKSKGIDGNKKVNGRKRHIAVDSQGLPRAIHISKADVHDSHGGLDLLLQLESSSERLELIVGDKAYGGMFRELAMEAYNIPGRRLPKDHLVK